MSTEEKGYRLSYKFPLFPTNEQKQYFIKNFDAARFVFNHFLEERIKAYTATQETLKTPVIDADTGRAVRDEKGKVVLEEKPNPDYVAGSKPMSFFDTSKALTQFKKEALDKTGNPWLKEVDATALVYSLRNLDNAYKQFFQRVKKGGQPGFPRFKSRKNPVQSFTIAPKIKIERDAITFPKIGRVAANVYREVEGQLVSATVSRTVSGKYFVAINVKGADIEPLKENSNEIGITMGINHWVVTSEGEAFDLPERIKYLEKRLKTEQRRLARKQKGSSNYHKQKLKVARIAEAIANTRNTATHALSRQLINEYGLVATRDMKPSEMAKNKGKAVENLPKKVKHKINHENSNGNYFELNRQLEYKALWANRTLVKVDSFEATAQTCSNCGHVNTFVAENLNQTWTCEECGAIHNRKYNGAQNVLKAAHNMLKEQEQKIIKEKK